MKQKILAIALGSAVVAVGLTTAPAQAGPATGNVSVGTQYGSVLRNQFRQNVDGSGYYWRTYGSGSCTATTSDVDTQWKDMDTENNWDNVASYAYDYNACDTKLYQFTNFDTTMTGWVDYGTGGQSLEGAALNNRTSSYRLS